MIVKIHKMKEYYHTSIIIRLIAFSLILFTAFISAQTNKTEDLSHNNPKVSDNDKKVKIYIVGQVPTKNLNLLSNSEIIYLKTKNSNKKQMRKNKNL